MGRDDRESRLSRAIAGDRDAASALFFEYYDQLHAYISARISSRHQTLVAAEDILQETVIDACDSIHDASLHSEQDFVRWLKAIAEHRLLDAIAREDAWKRGGRMQRAPNESKDSSDRLINLLEEIECDTKTPSQKFSMAERTAALEAQIEQLPTHYREVVSMRYGLNGDESLGQQEIATRTGRTVGQVRMLLSRALQKLRDAMADSSLG
jgi:RNA polymerase sigma-70 factor (ECF subfamily)